MRRRAAGIGYMALLVLVCNDVQRRGQQRVQQNNRHSYVVKLQPTVHHRMETFAETLPDKVQ